MAEKSLTWNPNRITYYKIIGGLNVKDRYKKFRSSSSGYISKKEVKQYVFNKYNNLCNICNSSEKLEVDHIHSVYNCFKEQRYHFCNSIENLQLLCKSCNIKKS